MNFFTGAKDVPPAGYDVGPSIYFGEKDFYPKASTCALQLTLPTQHCDYASFKAALDTAFLSHGGFGLS